MSERKMLMSDATISSCFLPCFKGRIRERNPAGLMRNSEDTRTDIERKSIQLVRAFLKDDKNAFDQLILLRKRMVFNVCYRFLGNYEDADDCAQEVFLKAYRSLKKFRFESTFSTWLYRIAVNTCKNKLNSLDYRLRFKKMRINNNKFPEEESPQSVDVGDETFSPDSSFRRKEISKLIQEAVNRLPTPQKIVIILRDMEGRSYEEIVEITGFKLGTVKSKLSRARQELREILRGRV
jgi:RNA polymerase sigma-70 factor (ECF subfamily)